MTEESIQLNQPNNNSYIVQNDDSIELVKQKMI